MKFHYSERIATRADLGVISIKRVHQVGSRALIVADDGQYTIHIFGKFRKDGMLVSRQKILAGCAVNVYVESPTPNGRHIISPLPATWPLWTPKVEEKKE